MKKTIENKKVMLGLLTMVLVLAIIVVSSFWPFILDPQRIMTTAFLTDELIITSITLSATVSMLFVAQAANASKAESEIAKAKVEFYKSINRIVERTTLFQWVKKVLQTKDREDIARREMEKMLIPFKVYELSEKEILSLTVAQKIEDKFYGPYDIQKLKAVIKLRKHIAKIKFVTPSYYTTVKSIDSTKNLSEMAASENIKKVLVVLVNLITKLILTWLFASILGSLVRDLTQEGGSNAQTWMTFMSRLFSFGSSCFLGYTVGCKLNDLDAFYILKRVEVHTMFLEDKTFKPVDEAKEAFKERVMKEQVLQIGGPADENQNI